MLRRVLLVTMITVPLLWIAGALSGVVRPPSLGEWGFILACALINVGISLLQSKGIRARQFAGAAVLVVYAVYLPLEVVSSRHDRHYDRGCECLHRGRDEGALVQFQKVLRLGPRWLVYNEYEAEAMDKLGQTYWRLGRFAEARRVHERMLARHYSKMYNARARAAIVDLDKFLPIVEKYEAWVAGKADFPYSLASQQPLSAFRWWVGDSSSIQANILFDVASVYEYDLHCERKALDVYCSIVGIDAPERDKQAAAKHLFRAWMKKGLYPPLWIPVF